MWVICHGLWPVFQICVRVTNVCYCWVSWRFYGPTQMRYFQKRLTIIISVLRDTARSRSQQWYNAIPCNTVRYNMITCNTIWYNAMTCKTIQYQYNSIQLIPLILCCYCPSFFFDCEHCNFHTWSRTNMRCRVWVKHEKWRKSYTAFQFYEFKVNVGPT